MPIYDAEAQDLVNLELNDLSLEEAFMYLNMGETLVIAGYEQTRGKDVLVKLDKRKYEVTMISLDIKPIVAGKRLWQVHNVSVNALSLHKVYKYNEYTYSMEFKFYPGSAVRIKEPATEHIYAVEAIFASPEKEIYYKLHTLDGYYHENELTTI